MSKFNYGEFYGGYDEFAVNSEKYTKDEAIILYIKEMIEGYERPDDIMISVGQYYVRHRPGRNEDNEPCVGWWIEYEQHDRSCPVYCFHTIDGDNDPRTPIDNRDGYELIKVQEWVKEHDLSIYFTLVKEFYPD